MAQWISIAVVAVLGLVGFWWRSLSEAEARKVQAAAEARARNDQSAAEAKARYGQAVREAEARALQDSKIAFMKGEIIQLQNQSQTDGERDAIEQRYEIQRQAHEREDNLRFANVTEAFAAVNGRLRDMDAKMDRILEAVQETKKA